MSTWTLDEPPTHLTWTNMDIWLTTYPPLLVHVVIGCPLILTEKTLKIRNSVSVSLHHWQRWWLPPLSMVYAQVPFFFFFCHEPIKASW